MRPAPPSTNGLSRRSSTRLVSGGGAAAGLAAGFAAAGFDTAAIAGAASEAFAMAAEAAATAALAADDALEAAAATGIAADATTAAGAGAGAGAGVEAAGLATGAAAATGAGVAAADAGLPAAAGVPSGTGTPGLPALAAVAAAPAAGAAPGLPSLLSSAMFLFNSATRVALSCAARCCAILSSAPDLPAAPPLDSVSLSGALAVGFFSSTCAVILPADWRSAGAAFDVGTFSATRRRNSLKSRLCATSVCLASSGGTSAASCSVGSCKTEPLRTRLMLPPMNASGLARSIATSIWSSETAGGLFALAILPAVSPACTVTCLPSPDGAAACEGAAAGAGEGAVAVAAGAREPRARVAGPAGGSGAGVDERACGAGVACACCGCCGARSAGGSNNIVKSRTRRPEAHVLSRITSMKGSLTGRVLTSRRK